MPAASHLERIGLFGGTFDPPHVGHLVTAVNVRHALRLDLVILMVANVPWQKQGTRAISPADDRLAMVAAAATPVIVHAKRVKSSRYIGESLGVMWSCGDRL